MMFMFRETSICFAVLCAVLFSTIEGNDTEKMPDLKKIRGKCECKVDCAYKGYLRAEIDGEACECSLPVIDYDVPKCVDKVCDRDCRRFGFPRGSCFNGKCRCDPLDQDED